MTKTKCNKIRNNKTLKITKGKKQIFVQKIIKEWKKQTNGFSKMDSTTQYKYDYYLFLNNSQDYTNNHIHLILKNKHKNHIFHGIHSTNNSIIYVMKKYDDKDKSKIIHSKAKRVRIFSDPAKIVKEMIEEYNKFHS